MVNFLLGLLGVLAIIAIFALVIFLASCFAGFNEIGCPDCGEPMEFIGSDEDLINNQINSDRHYYYKCPKCGKTKII